MTDIIDLACSKGLAYCGQEHGQPVFIGTAKEWEKFDEALNQRESIIL